MQFTKMHGTGNDYIYVDCLSRPLPDNVPELARRMSDRHFGVGADGLILICPSSQADAEMRMFNADGSPAEMCGNGIRCVAKFLYDRDICRQDTIRIESAGQVKSIDVTVAAGRVSAARVDMGEPILDPDRIPTTLRSPGAPADPVVEVPIAMGAGMVAVTCVSMGNPHCVTFVRELTDQWVLGHGPKLENDPLFPRRTNVEFVELISRTELRQRTWERGSGETLSCGTGACAVCVAGVLTRRTDRRVTIHLRGGDLQLEWDEATNHVFMTGPAEEVFTGEWPDAG